MSRKRTAILAWTLFAICVAGSVITLILLAAPSDGPLPQPNLPEFLMWRLLIPLVFSTLAALIINRQPGNRVGWLMMIIGLGASNPISIFLSSLPAAPKPITPGWFLLIWLDNWSWIPIIFPILLIPLYFPTGQTPSPRWNWVGRFAAGMWLFFILFIPFFKTLGPLNGGWTAPNPIGVVPDEVGQGVFLIFWSAGLITMVIASVISLFLRYRRARQGERQQIKWLLYAGAVFAIFYILTNLTNFLPQIADSFLRNLGDLLFVPSILAVPAAIAVAILRYRLYDIDLVIRRTLQYALLTGILALVYFGGVVFLQGIFGRVVGQTDSPLIVVVSTLAIAALFNPLRQRLQAFIDRRFYRQKYDAGQALTRFAATARDEVEMDKLILALMGAIEETMQPETLSISLRDSLRK